MSNLNNKTLFVSGGSRGIGLAIAKRCAKDGANVVLAAKTDKPHPRLPGTIHTAAAEIEAAGGKCLPCVVDIRDEATVDAAVAQAVEHFGGIDILINNASAISLTGTAATPMKTFDLMHQINLRGTFLCTQKCAPHLKKADNPHVLTLSPPLNMDPKWFGRHVAYTMAKYGMSMCVLGHAEEYRKAGIAVNGLWPQTAIWTAAMQVFSGGVDVSKKTRLDTIMADAAYAILTRDAKTCTGNFFIDEAVLREAGVTDFSPYLPEGAEEKDLLPDLFL